MARSASAQDAEREGDSEAIAVDYEAPPGCPGREGFLDEIRGRTPRARAADAGEPARVIIVRIEARGAAFLGHLTIEDGASRSSPRDVSGSTCSEIVGALGLVVALAVDPRASTAPIAPAPPPTASTAASSTAASQGRAPRRPSARAPSPEESHRVIVPRDHEPPLLALGTQGEISAMAGATYGARIFGELVVGRGVLAPALRIAVMRTLGVDRPARVGGATLTWTTAEMDLCPIRVSLLSSLDVRPCLGLGGGVLDAEGVRVAEPRSRGRPWASIDAHARLTWAPLRAVAVEAEIGAKSPFFRESFFFEPGVPIYEPPFAAGFGRVGVVVRFP